MSVPYDSYNYLSYWEKRSYEDNSERIALTRFFKNIAKKENLVDIGGGFGRLSSLYTSQFEKCVVVDPSEKNLALGKKMNTKYCNIVFLKGSLPNLPFQKEQFQTALMIRVSHHLQDLTPSFAEVSRILKKDGYFIFEFANKIHFLSIVKALLKGNFHFLSGLSWMERRSSESIREDKITFVNHHPKKIISDLGSLGFEVIDILSVSNFRNRFLKRIVPEFFLLKMEKFLQKPFSKIFFGPSIFILAKKDNTIVNTIRR